MAEDEIIFIASHAKAGVKYTLNKGAPLTYGWQHAIKRHPYLANKLHCVKHAVENYEISYWDENHYGEGDRERLYCKGADPERPELYMVVSAEYKTDYEATIITVWQTAKIPDFEVDPIYVKAE